MELEFRQYRDTKYWITNTGDVFSEEYKNSKCGGFLNPAPNKDGYLTTTLTIKNKAKSNAVHRLVGELFIKNPENYKYLNHINGNKSDNSINNLEWVSAKQNTQHALTNKLIKRKGHIRQISNKFWAYICINNYKYQKGFNSINDAKQYIKLMVRKGERND